MIKLNSKLTFRSKLTILTLFFVAFFMKANPTRVDYIFSSKCINNFFQLGNDLLELKVDFVESKKLLRISFNGNEGTDGELKIYNIQNKLVSTSNFELIKSPYYATVDITSLESGSYSVVLITNKGSHNSTLQIK